LSWKITVSSCPRFVAILVSTHVVKKDELVGPAAVEITDSVEDAVPDQGREKLLNEESQKTTTDDCQVQVVDLERTVQAESRTAPHELTTAQNDGVVYNERNDRLFVCRHESAAGHEAELLGRVAKHLLPCGGEDGPESDAEGTVESRKADLEAGEGRHAGERVVGLCCVCLRVLLQGATVLSSLNPAGSGGSNWVGFVGGRVQPPQQSHSLLPNARRGLQV
jgi:hypothetical protein